MTPLVDVTLVLLIIFIVTAKIVVTPAVPLDLPQASEGKELQVVFSVLLPKDGRIFVNGSVVANQEALEKRAGEALKNDNKLRAVIQADGDVPHREVLQSSTRSNVPGFHGLLSGPCPSSPVKGRPNDAL